MSHIPGTGKIAVETRQKGHFQRGGSVTGSVKDMYHQTKFWDSFFEIKYSKRSLSKGIKHKFLISQN